MVSAAPDLFPVDRRRVRPFHLPHMAPPGAARGCTVGTGVFLLCRCPSTFRTHSLCIRCLALLSSQSNHTEPDSAQGGAEPYCSIPRINGLAWDTGD